MKKKLKKEKQVMVLQDKLHHHSKSFLLKIKGSRCKWSTVDIDILNNENVRIRYRFGQD